jgi:hypothetical protein
LKVKFSDIIIIVLDHALYVTSTHHKCNIHLGNLL